MPLRAVPGPQRGDRAFVRKEAPERHRNDGAGSSECPGGGRLRVHRNTPPEGKFREAYFRTAPGWTEAGDEAECGGPPPPKSGVRIRGRRPSDRRRENKTVHRIQHRKKILRLKAEYPGKQCLTDDYPRSSHAFGTGPQAEEVSSLATPLLTVPSSSTDFNRHGSIVFSSANVFVRRSVIRPFLSERHSRAMPKGEKHPIH